MRQRVKTNSNNIQMLVFYVDKANNCGINHYQGNHLMLGNFLNQDGRLLKGSSAITKTMPVMRECHKMLKKRLLDGRSSREGAVEMDQTQVS